MLLLQAAAEAEHDPAGPAPAFWTPLAGARMVMLLENERAVTVDAQQCRSGEQSVQP